MIRFAKSSRSSSITRMKERKVSFYQVATNNHYRIDTSSSSLLPDVDKTLVK